MKKILQLVFLRSTAQEARHRTISKVFFSLVLLLFSHLAAPVTVVASPTTQLKETVTRILSVLKNEDILEAERKKNIIAAINNRFDFVAMSQRTLATYWKKASLSQKKEFTAAFSKLITEVYYNRLSQYSGERIEYLAETVKGERARIKTQIITASTAIPVLYKMRLKKQQWLVYDVKVEGVSLISNYRSGYRAVIDKNGLDVLIAKINKKTETMRKNQ